MGGQVDGWADGCLGWWIHRWIDKWINWLWVAGRIDIMDEYMGGLVGGQVDV